MQTPRIPNKTVNIFGILSSLEEAFESCWSLLADEHNISPKIDQKTRKIGQSYIWNPMTTGFIM